MGSTNGKPLSIDLVNSILEFRRQEVPIKQIAKALSVGVGTVHKYCSKLPENATIGDIVVKRKQQLDISSGNLTKATQAMSRINKERRDGAAQIALKEWPHIKSNPIILALVIGYWAEGSKRSTREFDITNSDPGFVVAIIHGLNGLNINLDEMYATINVYPQHDPIECVNQWKKATGLLCIKPYLKEWRGKQKQIYSKYGVCVLSVRRSRLLFIKIMTWIDLWRQELGVDNGWQVTKTERSKTHLTSG